MNITLDTQISTSNAGNTEVGTTTYRPAVHSQGAESTQNINMSGYTSDIADKVMDNEAYKGHGMTASDIMQQAANTDVNAQKDFMIVMSHCVSGEDFEEMAEEGFNPGSTDVETYVTILDRIKATLAQAGVDVEGYTDTLDMETLEQITGAVTQALEIKGMSDDAIKYMVENAKAPTIENLYKAQYSSTGSVVQSQGYYSDSAFGQYYAKKADNINWDNINPQIEAVVSEAGLDTDEAAKSAAMENAKWLVESGIELTADTLNQVTDLRNLSFPMDKEDIADMCAMAVANGKSPYEADMTGEESIAVQAKEIIKEVESISDEAVHNVAESDKDFTIKNLSAAQRQIEENLENTELSGTESITADETSLKEIQARRQLEEIRLMMSEEANRHLLRQGISIDTTKLSELVEALKETEARINETLFKGEDPEENADMASLYEDTLAKTSEIADMPAAVLGEVAMAQQSYTLLNIHEAGSRLLEDEAYAAQSGANDKAAAYETLMTSPRSDLGDSIKKAFRNVDDILKDMGLETSEANRRAVRILGYNSMDITKENIDAVKQADAKVTDVINKMTPATTLNMIREHKNPLEMDIDELDEYLNNKGEQSAEDALKYSKFLQKLDMSGEITEDEREAYIGIYRLFNQIEKSDGAVIGSIVATGAQMNFKNMLSAVRSSKDKNMDISIDDSFGALENLISKSKSIDVQINAGYQDNNAQSQDNTNQEKYYAKLSGEINRELSDKTDVDRLKDVEITPETTIEKFSGDIKSVRMAQDNPILEAQNSQQLEEFREGLREAANTDDWIIQELMNFDQSVSVNNIEAAQMLIYERGSLFKQILGGTKNYENEASENDTLESDASESEVLSKADAFVENLTDPKNARMSYQDIITEANKAIEEKIYAPEASYIDVRAAQTLYKGLSLASNMSLEENYEVPMNLNGEITSVNLKIYRNSMDKGKVAVTLDTESLGNVAAEFEVTSERVSGMIVYDRNDAETSLEELNSKISEVLSENGTKQVNVSLVQSDTADINRFGRDRSKGTADSGVATARLYQTAKTFLTVLKDIHGGELK
jgi:hypothetical protein